MPASPMTSVQTSAAGRTFPQFDLARLLGTVFEPTFGRRDLHPDRPAGPRRGEGSRVSQESGAHDPAARARAFLSRAARTACSRNWRSKGGEMFAYTQTSGSNLDLPDECVDMSGQAAEPGEGRLSELRHHPLHLDLLRHRAADGVREAVRLPRRDAARRE